MKIKIEHEIDVEEFLKNSKAEKLVIQSLNSGGWVAQFQKRFNYNMYNMTSAYGDTIEEALALAIKTLNEK